ncbi:sensor domain-containing diguanylate cyclase [Marinospirillum perlucidum]|uniref:sensor domain-containing diguanylate cyclase n=1 Tax=Marinospirillum perlucidum TaxID=1982602 RepID=UPI000DF2DC3A|nr:diguanylate cyclase [Marinospirillum perlucidum]
MSPKNLLFLTASLFLALLDITFVVYNNQRAEESFQHVIQEEGENLHRDYEATKAQTLDNLLFVATYISRDEQVQLLFEQATRAVEEEGGGPGGPRAAELRQQLLAEVQSSWQEVQKTFDARQLHFHLPPGSTSFLRVHKPEKFGDNMDNLRHIIVATNQDQTPRTGFETGRVYSGLRGVVPVFAPETSPEGPRHLGALEVGTSFEEIIKLFQQQYQIHGGVILTPTHITEKMWPDYVEERFGSDLLSCQCGIESKSSDFFPELIMLMQEKELAFFTSGTRTLESGETHYAVTRIPLYDYQASQSSQLGPAGSVIFWRDITADVRALESTLRFNILLGLLGFLFIELLLFLGLRLSLQHLEKEVERKTLELRQKNLHLHKISITDPLTGLYNRNAISKNIEEGIQQHQKHGQPLSLLLLDIDHFKTINDTYGHPAGDQVLITLAQLLRSNLRETDCPGRWGGEEFLLVCANTRLDQACKMAEKIHHCLNTTDFPGVGKVTASFGVVSHQLEEDASQLITRCDQALYQAKENGRNQVVAKE